MRFWDSSAVLPLALREPASEKAEALLRQNGDVVVWWGTVVECTSALARAVREGKLGASSHRKAQAVLEQLRLHAFEVQPVEEVRARALRLLAVHPLRTPEALQLAAALVWCRERTRGVCFLSLDARLREAALREGFTVLPQDESPEMDEA